jgi:hypothetical protein
VNLETALRRAVAERAGSPRAYRPVSIGDMLHFASRQQLASALSDDAPRKSQAYRTAMRNIQRWERGRTPNPESMEKLTDYLGELLSEDVTVEIEAEFKVSQDTRDRIISGVVVSGDALSSAEAFETAFIVSYGMPLTSVILDVDHLALS